MCADEIARPALKVLDGRGFRFFAAATFVSLVGDGLFRVAVSLQVYALVQDPRALAAVAVAWATGQFLFLPLGGWASDRYRKRSLLVTADLWRGAAMGALGALSVTSQLSLLRMALIGLAFGAGNAIFNPTATAFLPQIVRDEELVRANAVLAALRPVMLYVLGPLLGGFLVSGLGPGVAFLVNACTFVLSALLVARIPETGPPADAVAAAASPWSEALGGFRLVRRNRWLWVCMSGIAASGLAYHGPFEVLVPFRLVTDFGQTEAEAARSLSAILVATGLGSVLAAAWISRHSLPRRFLTAFYLVEAGGLSMLVVLGLMTSLWQGVVAGLVLGVCFGFTEVTWATTLQRHVARDALGRVASLDWMVNVGVAPLSLALAGVVAASVSASAVLVIAGGLGAGTLAALAAVPRARTPEHRPHSSPAVPPGDDAAVSVSDQST